MCTNISLHSDIQFTEEAYPDIKDERQLDLSLEYLQLVEAITFPFYNIIYRGEQPTALSAIWGFPTGKPEAAPDYVSTRLKLVNARSERLLDDTDRIWRDVIDQPCLIPVDGIFEQRRILTWKKKVPYYIWLKGRKTFHLPGLVKFHGMPDNDGVLQTVPHFTLITRTANEDMKLIHNDGDNKNRMPLFLTEEMEKAWISPNLTKAERQEILQYEMPPDGLAYHPVYTIFRKPERPDGKPPYAYYEWKNLPPLGDDHPLTPQMSLF